MNKILSSTLMLLIIMSGIISCKKDTTNAPAAVDGLTAHPGRNRAEVEFEAPDDAKTGKVFYGGGNFKEFVIADAGAPQKVTVEGLSEQEQMLRVVTINGDGVVSNPRGVKVNVYGSKYESELKPRKWADQVTHSATSLEFKFNEAVAGETGVRIVYTNTAGNNDSVTINSTENSVTVDNIDTTKAYYYYSVYKPEAAAIDDFYSPSLDLKTALMLDFKKSNWRIAESSSEDAENAAAGIIDNNANTMWLSSLGDASPQWVTIDMDNTKFIDGFYYINHPGVGAGAKSLKFEISQDNVTWTSVLQTEVVESYFRQRLPLNQRVAARYLKVSVLEVRNPNVSQIGFVELDAYNLQNVSADNGYQTSTPIALVNAKAPFTGDGSNPFPALGDFRMQKLSGWTHSSNAVVSYDNSGTAFSLFIAPVWGLPEVTNAKVYQSVDLQPGHYVLKVHSGAADGPADVYAVVSDGTSLPDYGAVPTAANTISYANVVEYQNKTVELLIVASEAKRVNIGVVYNLRSQYAATGLPWTSFKFNQFDLAKVE